MRHPGSIVEVTLAEMESIIAVDIPPWRIRTMIWHHSFRPSARGYRGRRTMVGVRGYHMRRPPRGCGWIDVGYPGALLGPDGSIWTGRSLLRGGAHCIGHNRDGVGIMLCLNGDREQLDHFPDMKEALLAVTTAYCETHDLDEHDIYGHAEFSTRSCPGRNVNIPGLRAVVGDRLGIIVPPVVRLKLSDGSTYNLVEGLPLTNAGGEIVAMNDCQVPLNGGVELRNGDGVRDALEAHGWEVAAWHAHHGPAGTVYARRQLG